MDIPYCYCYYKALRYKKQENHAIKFLPGGVDTIHIREYAKSKKVNLWEVSEELGYAHETAFSRALRHELTPEIKQKIFKIIDELAQM